MIQNNENEKEMGVKNTENRHDSENHTRGTTSIPLKIEEVEMENENEMIVKGTLVVQEIVNRYMIKVSEMFRKQDPLIFMELLL